MPSTVHFYGDMSLKINTIDFDLFPLHCSSSNRDQASGNARRLIVGCFVHSWLPPSLSAADSLENLRSSDLINFAQVFLIDAQACPEALWDYGYTSLSHH